MAEVNPSIDEQMELPNHDNDSLRVMHSDYQLNSAARSFAINIRDNIPCPNINCDNSYGVQYQLQITYDELDRKEIPGLALNDEDMEGSVFARKGYKIRLNMLKKSLLARGRAARGTVSRLCSPGTVVTRSRRPISHTVPHVALNRVTTGRFDRRGRGARGRVPALGFSIDNKSWGKK